jgi:hypothetical protein
MKEVLLPATLNILPSNMDCELEKNVQPVEDSSAEVKTDEVEGTSINDIDAVEGVNTIMSVDLKNIIKQELAAGSN